MSEIENKFGKDLNFKASESSFSGGENYQYQDRKGNKEQKEQNWKPVPVGELKLEDLDNLDEDGQKFVSDIIQYVSYRLSPQVSEDVLNFSFLKAVEVILANSVKNQQASDSSSPYQPKFEDIVKIDEKSLKEILKIVVPTNMPTSIENLKLNESVKNDIYKAVEEIRSNIEDYAKQNGDLLVEPKGVKKFTNLVKSNLGINNESADKRKELLDQIKFLDEIEDLTAQGTLKLTPEMLSKKVVYLDHASKKFMADTLAKALEYGTSHIPSLNEYIERLKDPEKLPGRILLSKVVDVFKKIAGGYAEPSSTLQRDVEFFKNGTALGARTGSYSRLQEHEVKMINVKY